MPLSTFDMALQRGQLLTHLQPIIELETGLITALEARVRWQVSLDEGIERSRGAARGR